MLILVAVDGYDFKAMLAELTHLLPVEGHELLFVYVIDTGVRGGMDLVRDRFHGRHLPAERAQTLGAAEREKADSILTEAAGLAASKGVVVHMEAGSGEPGRVLTRLAAERRASLIVIGGRSSYGEFSPGPKSLGHTARFVLDHSPCPVLLLRHGEPPPG
ncbi:MAG: universal stress protein [Candidatus Dormibacteraceae bacterium]